MKRQPLHCQHFDLKDRLILRDDQRFTKRHTAAPAALLIVGTFWMLYHVAQAVRPLLDSITLGR